MTSGWRTLLLVASVGLGSAAGAALVASSPAGSDAASRPAPAPVPASPDRAPTRWIVAGGGATPDSNQHSIEADLGLAVEVLDGLGGGGRLLYAGGPGTRAVQVLDEAPRGDALLARLGHLFAPRAGRDAHYRETRLEPEGPATAERVLETIAGEVGAPGPPLLVYVAGHGEPGEDAADNVVVFWGQGALTPVDLAERLDAVPDARPLRLVVSTCHAGGFTEVLFQGGDAAREPARVTRCGLFATTWDRQASGCDPDPDRRRHEGYGIHFLHALRGEDRDGRPLPPEELDFDGDGIVTLLEAHGRVRVASSGVEVPTTTSERWLRLAAPTGAAGQPVALPVEDAVVAALAASLSVPPQAGAVEARVARLEEAPRRLDQELLEARDEELRLFEEVAARLLSRWPVLDDPWHPDFGGTLERERARVEAFLDGDPGYRAFLGASAHVDRLDLRMAELERREARLLRLARALDNRELAARLKARGGFGWEVFQSLRACEASAP